MISVGKARPKRIFLGFSHVLGPSRFCSELPCRAASAWSTAGSPEACLHPPARLAQSPRLAR